jgi:exodeoxyribonuclease V alpha subunit
LERNLLYTAVTRGRKLVVIISEPKALRMAVKRQESQRRMTWVGERLREGDQADEDRESSIVSVS